MAEHVDDEGTRLDVTDRVRRVVSLVPSLTEAVAVTAPSLLVGVTDWCTHPDDLDDLGTRPLQRIGGTKNPDVDAVADLAPDLVLANQEENKPSEIARLRQAGLTVYVTDVRTVEGAMVSLERMLSACGLDRPAWLDGARAAWGEVPRTLGSRPRRRALVPVWRKPWMAVGADTFTGAVLDRLGLDNVLADPAHNPSGERYPRFDPTGVPEVDVVVLPDEPYPFTADDGPETFAAPSVLVSGRLLTWYGPSLLAAARELPAALAPDPSPTA